MSSKQDSEAEGCGCLIGCLGFVLVAIGVAYNFGLGATLITIGALFIGVFFLAVIAD